MKVYQILLNLTELQPREIEVSKRTENAYWVKGEKTPSRKFTIHTETYDNKKQALDALEFKIQCQINHHKWGVSYHKKMQKEFKKINQLI